MSDEKKSAWIEFFGKLITPLTIIILVLIFKSTVEERLSQASEVSVLGSNFKFDTNSFHGQLSALELYYLIHASVNEDLRTNIDGLEGKKRAAIYLLQSKGLIKLTKWETERAGNYQIITIEATGQQLVEKLGLTS